MTRMPGLVLRDSTYDIPLDHDRPDGPHLELYAREVGAAWAAREDLSWLVFLQGGPGGKAPCGAAVARCSTGFWP